MALGAISGGAVTTLAAASLSQGIIAGAMAFGAAGFVSGAINAVIMGARSFSDIFKAAAIGGLKGALIGGVIGGIDLATFGDMIARGAVEGGMSELQGGDFKTGFLSAAFTAGAFGFGGGLFESFGDTMSKIFGEVGGLDVGDIAAKTMIAAAVGGTASKLGGGKFADGAATAAFITMFRATARDMRRTMVKQSNLDPRNASGKSVGFRGDGFKLAGNRFNPNNPNAKPSPLGGTQGGQGRLGIPFTDIHMEYSSGSLLDRVHEAFAGPHDYLNNPFWYNQDTGNIRDVFAKPWMKPVAAVGEALSLANVAVAAPLVAASVVDNQVLYGGMRDYQQRERMLNR